MAELKTKRNDADVDQFLSKITDDGKRKDAMAVKELMEELTGYKPKMWGDSIVGFGTYQYKYSSGRSSEWMYVGFSPRKQNLTLYIMSGFGNYGTLMEKLGKYSTGKSCLYLKRLTDVDEEVLRQLIVESVQFLKESHD